MDVFLQGKRLKLSPAQSIGKGGEADVFALGADRAVKIFKTPDHPDYAGSAFEQQSAEQRIAMQQRKLPRFPAQLPPQVIAPEQLVTDKSGRHIAGYAMRLVAPAEPILRWADPVFRRAGVPSQRVVELFRRLHPVLSSLHRASVVVGDFNDRNILVAGSEAHLIDADSFQFGGFPCAVFTERFVDPLVCEPSAPALQLARAYTPDSDWYAFAALLLQSLVFVGPYGGVHRPKDPAKRVSPAARPLHRITVFSPEVQYPKPAASLSTLPDELLHKLQQIFEKDERGPFPPRLLEELRFATCPRCGVEHARLACPACSPSAALRPTLVLQVRGEVSCTRLFQTGGVILKASAAQGELSLLVHEAGAFKREDGSVVLNGDLDPSLRFWLQGAATLIGRGREVVSIEPGRSPERLAVDSDGAGPAVATDGRRRFWAQDGRLYREPSAIGSASLKLASAPEYVADVLANQTRLWVGPAFGLGLYRAGTLSMAFTFDGGHRGITESLLPPIRGELLDAACSLDEQRAWLLLCLHEGGRSRNLCLVYGRDGALQATAEAAAGDGSWLGALGGKCAVSGSLLAATDEGIVRVEVKGAAVEKTRSFPDTEPFVDSSCQLLTGREGLLVVKPREVLALKMM